VSDSVLSGRVPYWVTRGRASVVLQPRTNGSGAAIALAPIVAADERLAVERERHEARPGACDRQPREEGKDLRRVSTIDRDPGASLVGMPPAISRRVRVAILFTVPGER
jgi:hypothetical protein